MNLLVVLGYLLGIALLTRHFARQRSSTRDYFARGRRIPTWVIAGSIAATETSAVTFISIPAIAYARGGNLELLQLALGYVVGRLVISVVFIPGYFRGELQSVYELLGLRFGTRSRRAASALFIIMRTIGDAIRLVLTATVIAAVLPPLLPGAPIDLLPLAVIAVGGAILAFTYFGGLEAVIWIELLQLAIYLVGAIAVGAVLLGQIPGGFDTVASLASSQGKLSFFDPSLSFFKTYTFWAGLVGGGFLSLSTHGTDQYMVQRYLCAENARAACRALIASGILVFFQFALFLGIGLLLFAFYRPDLAPTYASGPISHPFARLDEVFPSFIANELPSALQGLVIAAILATALSSSLPALAASALRDFGHTDERDSLRRARRLVLVFGAIQIVVALLLLGSGRSALDQVLALAGLVNGPILGLFLLGNFTRSLRESSALIGLFLGLAVVIVISFATPIAWTWYSMIGAVAVFLSACTHHSLTRQPAHS
jgi:SSS family transporter